MWQLRRATATWALQNQKVLTGKKVVSLHHFFKNVFPSSPSKWKRSSTRARDQKYQLKPKCGLTCCVHTEHRSWSVSWFRQLSTFNSCTLQMHGVTSIFGVRWWNQVQNVRAQCPHLSAFLKKCSDQNCRYATWKTCTLPFRFIFGILRQALPRPTSLSAEYAPQTDARA